MTSRRILRQHPAFRDDIGDLVTRRPLPGPGIEHLDPFLFLNHHGPQLYPPNNRGLPFGPHPHRGFETVTFILDGELSHLDSGGHESIIHAGGVQWMTAGRGLVHAELSPQSFKERGGKLEILQLWVNLPARLKMTQPAYTGLEAKDLPVVEEGKAKLTLVSGHWFGREGPVQPLAGVEIVLILLSPGASLTIPVGPGRNIFLYVVRGEAEIAGEAAKSHHLIELGEGDEVELSAREPAMLLFGHAEPFGESIVSHGPFVMNSREEIVQAIQDYQAGRFGSL